MAGRFPWVPDVTRGEWLRSVETEPFGSVLAMVPRGFPAYARVFHPVGRTGPPDAATRRGTGRTACPADAADITAAPEPATWAQVAASFGTTMHAGAQYARLVRRTGEHSAETLAPDGRRYTDPVVGRLDAISLAAVAAVLTRHTATPHAGVAAVWEGWGGLVSSAGAARLVMVSGEGPSAPDEDAAAPPGEPAVPDPPAAVGSDTSAALPDHPDEPEPGTGLLPREVVTGPRLDLHGTTGRHYILFEAGARDFADPAWPARAPWADEAAWAPSPSILWPDDHAWVLATEIDLDSTLVAGSAALIRDLVRAPGPEVLPLRPDADLSWDGDALNSAG